MANEVKHIPEGFHTITPYLLLKDVKNFLVFLRNAYDAEDISTSETPDGTIMHAQVKIGDSFMMMGEASGEWKPMPASIYLYVNDVDSVYNKAIKAGAQSLMEPRNEFYGDRMAGVGDSFGNMWWIATHIEDVSPEEMKKREEDYMKQKR